MAGKMKTSVSVQSAKKADEERWSLWRHRGVEAVYFQREAQVNFWTVMGGIATAALLTQFSSLLREMQASRWYLIFFFLSSIASIVNSWEQTAWASLILRWPVSMPVTLLIFLTQISLAIQCLFVTNPMGWMASTGMIILFSLIHNNYNRISGSWSIFSPLRVQGLKTGMWIYLGFLVFCLISVAQLYFFPSHLSEAVWGVVVILLSTVSLIMQHQATETERKELNIP